MSCYWGGTFEPSLAGYAICAGRAVWWLASIPPRMDEPPDLTRITLRNCTTHALRTHRFTCVRVLYFRWSIASFLHPATTRCTGNTMNSAENKTENPPPSSSWFDRGLLIATLLTCAVALSPNPADPDLWGHVQYGKDALAAGLPATTTYSYSAVGYRWINHENLAEVLLAVGSDHLGPIGMLWVKCLLGVGVIGLIMARASRQGVGKVSLSVVALLVSVNLSYFWSMRPQLLSFVYLALLIYLLSWCFSGWEGRCHMPWLRGRHDEPGEINYSSRRMRCLWLAPILFFFWANTHGGFVAGYCIFLAYLGMRGFEAYLSAGKSSFGLLRRFTMMGAAAGLGTLINPYGPRLHLWLLESLRVPRPEILEWHAPDLTSTTMIPVWLIMFTWFAVMLLSQRSRDVTHLTILTITLWQSLEHVRHIPFFAIPFGFWIAPHVDSVLRRFNVVSNVSNFGTDISPRMRNGFVAVLGLAFLLLGYRLYDRLSDMPVKRSEYPVSAFQFLADQQLHGNLVVTYNWAQYAIAAFGSETSQDEGIRVSFDGRFRTCYPQEVVDMNFDFVLGDLEPRYRGKHSPPFDDQAVLSFGAPDLVLLNRRQPHGVNVMFRNRESWALLYQDEIAQIWGRRSRFDDPTQADYIPDGSRNISDDEQVGTVTWPAMPHGQAETLALLGAS